MTKLYSEKNGKTASSSVNCLKNRPETFLVNKLKSPISNSLWIDFLRSVYLILSLTGLAGTLLIIYNVMSLPHVNSISMILVFLLSCFPMAVMIAGLYGFSSVAENQDELNSAPKRISTLRKGKNKTAAFSGHAGCTYFSTIAFNKILDKNETYS